MSQYYHEKIEINGIKCTVNIYISIQGFCGDEKIGNVVQCAMFSNAFPSVKSPPGTGFQGGNGKCNKRRGCEH